MVRRRLVGRSRQLLRLGLLDPVHNRLPVLHRRRLLALRKLSHRQLPPVAQHRHRAVGRLAYGHLRAPQPVPVRRKNLIRAITQPSDTHRVGHRGSVCPALDSSDEIFAPYRPHDPGFEPAMRHLEELRPPTIFAPEAARQAPVTASVPHNDADRVLDLYAKGSTSSDIKKARQKAKSSTTRRTRRSRSFEGPVTYEWPANGATTSYLPTLKNIVEAVSAVGQGIDVVIARAEVAEDSSPVPGIKYTPTPTGRLRLNVPYPRALDVLDERYATFRNRMGSSGMALEAEPTHLQCGYTSELDLPPVRCAAFLLKDMGDRPLVFEGVRAMDVAAMVRHVIGRAARRAGLPNETVAEIMGHGADSRIRAHPLPNVGHFHADGRIRRVMLTAPTSVAEDTWGEVLSPRERDGPDTRRRVDTGRYLGPNHSQGPDSLKIPGRIEVVDNGNPHCPAWPRYATRPAASRTDRSTAPPARSCPGGYGGRSYP